MFTAKGLPVRALQRIAGKCMSMSVIWPASLWTRAMFATVAALDKSGRSQLDISRDASANLLGELRQWSALSATSHEGSWQRAPLFSTSLTSGASDASSIEWGVVFETAAGPFRASHVFPREWLPTHINKKDMFALFNLLRQFCTRFPDALRRARV